MDEIVKRWKKAGFSTDGTIAGLPLTPSSVGPRPTDFTLPRGLVRRFAKLIADHEETREKPLDAATRLFVGLKPENEKFLDALRPTITQWLDVTDWFMKKTHDPGSPEASVDKSELQSKFKVFEAILLAIVQGFSTFFATTDAIDEILEEANS